MLSLVREVKKSDKIWQSLFGLKYVETCRKDSSGPRRNRQRLKILEIDWFLARIRRLLASCYPRREEVCPQNLSVSEEQVIVLFPWCVRSRSHVGSVVCVALNAKKHKKESIFQCGMIDYRPNNSVKSGSISEL